ncbi:MAG: MarR family transcriptional regulator [Clostridia bacterium]|nr:MarR family transcriptional regulator [Clostridia bacterium]
MEQLTLRLMEELRKNAILMRRSFHRAGSQVGSHSRLLTLLLENPGISQKSLCQLLHIRPQSLGEQLFKLESAGLLTRQSNRHDRRIFNLYLTEAGVAEAKALDAKHDATRRMIFADMAESDMTALLALLEKLNASIVNNVELSEPHRHFPEE